jgi:hypothetical protein
VGGKGKRNKSQKRKQRQQKKAEENKWINKRNDKVINSGASDHRSLPTPGGLLMVQTQRCRRG